MGETPKFDPDKYESDKEVPFVFEDDSVAGSIAIPVKNQEITSGNDISESTVSVNNIKCTFAKKGTSLLAIATNHDIQLSRLLEFNDMETDGILNKDQLVFLERKEKKGANEFYTVQPGETLHDVAQKTGVQLQYLAEYNQLQKGTLVDAGTKLWLQNAKGANDIKQATAKAGAP